MGFSFSHFLLFLLVSVLGLVDGLHGSSGRRRPVGGYQQCSNGFHSGFRQCDKLGIHIYDDNGALYEYRTIPANECHIDRIAFFGDPDISTLWTCNGDGSMTYSRYNDIDCGGSSGTAVEEYTIASGFYDAIADVAAPGTAFHDIFQHQNSYSANVDINCGASRSRRSGYANNKCVVSVLMFSVDECPSADAFDEADVFLTTLLNDANMIATENQVVGDCETRHTLDYWYIPECTGTGTGTDGGDRFAVTKFEKRANNPGCDGNDVFDDPNDESGAKNTFGVNGYNIGDNHECMPIAEFSELGPLLGDGQSYMYFLIGCPASKRHRYRNRSRGH